MSSNWRTFLEDYEGLITRLVLTVIILPPVDAFIFYTVLQYCLVLLPGSTLKHPYKSSQKVGIFCELLGAVNQLYY